MSDVPDSGRRRLFPEVLIVLRMLIILTVILAVAADPAFSAAACRQPPADENSRPNVLLIMADDLGFSDLGCYGSEIQTPNLDGLAASGVRFNQFYNTAKCHSSRICLLTGKYCFQAGNESLSEAATIAEVMAEAGYFTAMTGKWHLQGEPTDRGFQRYFGHLSGATNYFRGDNTFRLNGKPWTDFGDDFYTTDAVTDSAIRFIDEARATGRPFFTYIAYNAPHYPLQAKEEDVLRYEGVYDAGWDRIRAARYARQVQSGLISADHALSDRPDYVPEWEQLTADERQWEADRMEVFAAMVDCLDQNIGRVLSHLKATDQYENTLILFCSDNGACPFERTRGRQKAPWDPDSYWCYDVGWAHVGNTPFRWYKQNQHEGGTASPLIVSWPSGLKLTPGTIHPEVSHLIDLLPTIAEAGRTAPLAELNGRALQPIQGRSLLPVFSGRPREGHPWLYFQFADNRAIRAGDWKLVSARGGRWELYNLRTDRTELHDLSEEHPEQVERLRKMWFEAAATDRLPKRLQKPVGNSRKTFPAAQRTKRSTDRPE